MTDNMGVDNIENRILFDKYIGLWGNLDMSTQAELKPISYPEFIKCPIKLQKIDFISSGITLNFLMKLSVFRVSHFQIA